MSAGMIFDPSTSRVRVAILDDRQRVLDSMSRWITANAPEFDVTLSACTWLELVHSDQFPTQLVIMDFQLSERVSIEARLRTCRAAGAKVIVLSELETREARERSLAAGASAFLSKAMAMTEVMDVARTVMGRGHAARSQQDWRPPPTGAVMPERPRLSAGESEALRLYASGYSTTEVAQKMNVQYETAKTYIRRVREKYAKANRPASKKAELIRRAAEDGYLS